MSALPAVLRLLATALVLTIVFEVALAAFLGIRTQRELAVVALAQVVTNPSVELLCLATGWRASLPLASGPWLVMLLAEVVALVVEALLYRTSGVGQRPWLLSAALNTFSFGTGLALAGLGII